MRLKIQTQAQQIAQSSHLHPKKEKPVNSLDAAQQECPQDEQMSQEDFFLAGKKGSRQRQRQVAKDLCRALIAAQRTIKLLNANCL